MTIQNIAAGQTTGTEAAEILNELIGVVNGLPPFRLVEQAPTSATSPGQKWDVAIDSDYFYLCVAPNEWRLWTLASW